MGWKDELSQYRQGPQSSWKDELTGYKASTAVAEPPAQPQRKWWEGGSASDPAVLRTSQFIPGAATNLLKSDVDKWTAPDWKSSIPDEKDWYFPKEDQAANIARFEQGQYRRKKLTGGVGKPFTAGHGDIHGVEGYIRSGAKPIGAKENIRRGDLLSKLPFSTVNAAEMLDVLGAVKRLEAEDFTKYTEAGIDTEKGKLRDQRVVDEYFKAIQEQSVRGKTFMADVGSGVSELPAWMVEFYVTGGLAKLASKGVATAGLKFMGKYVKTQAGRHALANALRVTAATVITPTIRTLQQPHRVVEGAVGNMIQGDQPMTAWLKAGVSQNIENWSETMGGQITKGLRTSFATKDVMRVFDDFAKARYIARGGTGEAFGKVIKAGGYDGLIGELGEEWLGGMSQALLGTETFGAEQTGDFLKDTQARLDAAVIALGKQTPSMAATLAVPGAIKGGLDIAGRAGQEPPQPTTVQPVKPQAAKPPAKGEPEGVKPTKPLNKMQQRNADALAKFPNADVVEGTMSVRMKNPKGTVFQVPAGQIEKLQEKGYALVERTKAVREPAEAAKGKEPWEMTKEEFEKHHEARLLSEPGPGGTNKYYIYRDGKGITVAIGDTPKEALADHRRGQIKGAIQFKQDVPAEVLKDYLELVKPAPTEAAKEPSVPVTEGEVSYTSVPKGWHGFESLQDWGQKGLRAPGNVAVEGRKTFVWQHEFEKLPTRLPAKTLKALKAKTDEIWRVQSRKKGVEGYWLVPKQVVDDVKAILGEKAFEQAPKKEASPKQQLTYAVQGMKIALKNGKLQAHEIGRNIIDLAGELKISLDSIADSYKIYVQEYKEYLAYDKKGKSVAPGVAETVGGKVFDSEAAAEREAIQNEAEFDEEIGGFLDGLEVEAKKPVVGRDVDLLGRAILKGGALGKQTSFLNKEDYKTEQAKESDEARRLDIEGQAKLPAPKPQQQQRVKAGKGTAVIGTVSKGRIKVSMEPEGKTQTAAEIVHYVERAFNIPLRGKATHRKHALGWFDPRAVGIRLKNVRSLTTAMHEIGHHIDWTLNKRLSLNPPKGTKDELMALGKALYGSRKPPGGYKSEGWAEFMRMDLTGDDTEAAAPNLHKWFHETYLPSHQDIRKKLDKTREMITRWRMQGAEARIESQINRKTIKGTIGERLERGVLWFETKWIDKFAPIRKAVQATGEELRWDLDPFQLATARASKAGSIARQMVLEYTTDTAGNYTGPGLRKVIKPIRKDIRAFTRYMMAARARDLWRRGKNPGISQADADFVFDKYDTPAWEDAAQAVTDWNHRVLDYLVEAGGLEPEVATRMKKLNPVYIPFMRAFKMGEINVGGGVGRGITKTGKGVKAIKGSGRQIIDPLESMIQQTEKLLSVAHKTEVARALAGLAKKKGMAKWIWKVPAPKQATQFEAEQLKKEITQIAVERLGLDPADIPFQTETWDDVLTVFTNAGQFFGKENIVAIVVDGQKQFFEVHPQLYRAIEGLDKYNLPPIIDMLFGKTTRMLRLGATGLNAAFGLIRNPIRDALTFTVLSKHAKLGPISAASGIVQDVINTKAARKFKALGGKMSGQVLFDRTATQHLRGELLATTIGGKAVYHATHPINALRELFGVTEAGTRIGEFGPALKAAEKKYGVGSKAAAIEALNAAQDVTTNFTRNGEIGRVLNQVIPFFNAGIQGPSKILRTFRARPIETMIKALVALTLPALWLWWKNRDKDWYKNLPLYEKTSYLHIEVPGEDKIIRLPVPFELGHVFQSIPVAILDAQYQDDPDSMKGTMVEVMEKANPFDWPALIGPIIDVIANENFAGIPIVSRSMEGKLPEDRVKSHTTALMRELGKVLGVSPAQLEHLVNSYSGGIYKRTARAFEKRGDSPSDIPVIGTLFLRDPFAPKAQVEKFYERSDLLDQKNQSDQITPAENRERLRLGRIRRKLSPLWKNLRTAKTTKQRKQIWAKVETEIKKAH